MSKQNITEGLKSKDLNGLVLDTFNIDRFKSKMGEDEDIIVIGFKVKEKYPAIDLMEFIEKSYPFILDADISSGEEQDGLYHVFVEMERTKSFPTQLKTLFHGVEKLTNCYEWKYSYQTSSNVKDLDYDNLYEQIPLTPVDYKKYMLERKQSDIKKFLDAGSTDITLDEDNTITFSKPYSGNLKAKFISIGDFDAVKNTLPGALDLSESSQSQIFFLTKYLGNYDINKIGNKFLIRNNDRAMVIEKDYW